MMTMKVAIRAKLVIFAIALSLGVMGTLLYTPTAYAFHWWAPFHWARTTPQFTLKVGNNLTTRAWKGHLARASRNWNSPEKFGAVSTPVLTAIVAGNSRGKRCKRIAGTVQVCNREYGNNGWLGLASINIIYGEHITQGIVKVNDTYFNTSTYNNRNIRQHVMCQEIGHTLGLDHRSTNGRSYNTCMDYFLNIGANAANSKSTRPNAHDFRELNTIYNGHLDPYTTISSLTSGVISSDVTDDPNSWGQLMSDRTDEQSAYYEKYNADGTLTITHVYWTVEVAAQCKGCDHRYGL